MPNLRRRMWLIGAAGAALIALLCFAVPYSAVREDSAVVSNTAPETLPGRLSNEQFWQIVSGFSEAGGYFRSDNFLSNEGTYQRIIPTVKKRVRPGGVY